MPILDFLLHKLPGEKSRGEKVHKAKPYESQKTERGEKIAKTTFYIFFLNPLLLREKVVAKTQMVKRGGKDVSLACILFRVPITVDVDADQNNMAMTRKDLFMSFTL